MAPSDRGMIAGTNGQEQVVGPQLEAVQSGASGCSSEDVRRLARAHTEWTPQNGESPLWAMYLRTVIDAIPEMTIVIDRDYQIVFANRAARQKAVGSDPVANCLKCHQVLHRSEIPCESQGERCLMTEVVKTNRPTIAERSLDDADGNKIHWEILASPIFDENGEVTQIIESCRDITDRKLVECGREELIADLESKNAELERFTYSVSHDLKSPLITLKAFLGLLRADMAVGKCEAVESDLNRMETAANKMAQLLDELLQLSRIGRLVNEPECVPLDELVREAIDLLRGQLDEAGVSVEIKPELPSLFGDRQRLLEVIQNLLDNAIKYMGRQPHPIIEIGSRHADGAVACYVKDNGLGIDLGCQEKIFGLFHQLDQSFEGAGVGLALAKRIVELHGGRIWVESEGAGQGSVFCFSIPLKE